MSLSSIVSSGAGLCTIAGDRESEFDDCGDWARRNTGDDGRLLHVAAERQAESLTYSIVRLKPDLRADGYL